ncbi:hypothetical protein EYR36_007595, partial [Pleurotus pulmonarius]
MRAGYSIRGPPLLDPRSLSPTMEPNASGSTVKKQEDPPEDSKPPKQDVKPVVKTLNRVPSMSPITLPAEDSLICPLLDLSRGL